MGLEFSSLKNGGDEQKREEAGQNWMEMAD